MHPQGQPKSGIFRVRFSSEIGHDPRFHRLAASTYDVVSNYTIFSTIFKIFHLYFWCCGTVLIPAPESTFQYHKTIFRFITFFSGVTNSSPIDRRRKGQEVWPETPLPPRSPQQQRAQTSRFLGEKEGKQEKAALLNLPFSQSGFAFPVGVILLRGTGTNCVDLVSTVILLQ